MAFPIAISYVLRTDASSHPPPPPHTPPHPLTTLAPTASLAQWLRRPHGGRHTRVPFPLFPWGFFSGSSHTINLENWYLLLSIIKKKAIFHCKTEGYSPNQDALHQLARHQQTIIFRLRTSHCRLNSHLKRIGVKTSAQCPCGEADQTPEHYLQSLSLHQQTRQQIWPTCVSLKTKLWGSAEDLLLTSRYAALTGERI